MEIFETVVEALCRLKKKRMAQGSSNPYSFRSVVYFRVNSILASFFGSANLPPTGKETNIRVVGNYSDHLTTKEVIDGRDH